ncbi:MAG: WD40 repeat domain-containing protein [Chloroflexi bacterium]|nr:WD40 repeat domain-containing protein [Chloroflexota bacterium]
MQKPRMSWGKGVIRGLVLSPDQTYLAVICAAGVDLYEARTLRLIQTYCTGDCPVLACTFSPDSRTLIAGGQHIFFWDIDSGQLIRTLPDAGQGLSELHVNEHYLVANIGRTVHIWNLDSEQHYTAERSTSGISRLILRDNVIFALGIRLHLFDVRSGYLVRELRINNHKIVHMALRDNEIALLDWDNQLAIWNLQTHQKLLTQKDMVGDFLSVWRDRFVVIDTHKRLCGIDVETKKAVFRYESRYRRAGAVALSDDRLYCATIDGILQMYTDTPQETSPYTSEFQMVAFSPNDQFVAAGGTETIYVWDTRTGEIYRKHHLHNNIVQFWFHNERTLAVDVHNDVFLLHLDCGETESFFSARYGRQIAPLPPYLAYRDNGTLHLWDGRNIMKSIPLAVEQAVIDYDTLTQRLAIGSNNQGFLVWDFAREITIFASDCESGDFSRFASVRAIAIRGNTLAAVKNRNLYVWSIDSNWLRFTTGLHTPEITALLLSRDEQFIFIQQNNGHIHICRTEDGLLMHIIKSPQYGVRGMALSSDDRTLATVGRDGTVAFWDV